MMIGMKLAGWKPYILSLLRIVVGLLFLQHGLSKMFGFPGPVPANFNWLTMYGLAALIETVGGVLVTVGLFTRVAAFIMSGEMAFAFFIGHLPRGFIPMNNGGSLAVLYCFVFLYLAAAGGGRWSLDSMRK